MKGQVQKLLEKLEAPNAVEKINIIKETYNQLQKYMKHLIKMQKYLKYNTFVCLIINDGCDKKLIIYKIIDTNSELDIQ